MRKVTGDDYFFRSAFCRLDFHGSSEELSSLEVVHQCIGLEALHGQCFINLIDILDLLERGAYGFF